MTLTMPNGETQTKTYPSEACARAMAQKHTDRGMVATARPVEPKAKKPTLAQVAVLKAEAQRAFEAWGFGAGTEEQRLAYKAAYAAYETALHARRPALAERAKLVARRLEADGETFR